MTKKLIAIDLDGTTLNNLSQISAKTAQVLAKASQAGHYVTIATGRPYRMSQQFYDELKLTTPMVNFNGALVHLPHQQWDGETEAFIHRDIAFDILAQKEQLDLEFIAAENKTSLYIDDFKFLDPNMFLYEKAQQNLLSAATMKINPTSLLLKLKGQKAESVAAVLKKQYGDEVSINTWGGVSPVLEVVAKGIQKAVGVAQAADHLGIQQKDIMAFGDEHNDLEMLAYAGWGVAMANGTAAAKEAANDVTDLTNDDNGLADYLEKYLSL